MIRFRPVVVSVVLGALVLPAAAVPQTQDTSNASLQDTLVWLSNFLPSATGASYTIGARSKYTTQISGWNSCSITVVRAIDFAAAPGFDAGTGEERNEFSLSDIDPKSIRATDPPGIFVVMTSSTKSIRQTITWSDGKSSQAMSTSVQPGSFNDRAGAERAANAFRHAVNLCAKPQIF